MYAFFSRGNLCDIGIPFLPLFHESYNLKQGAAINCALFFPLFYRLEGFHHFHLFQSKVHYQVYKYCK